MKSDEKVYFPLFVDLTKKKVVFIGAGFIAQRRATVLSDFCSNITVIAPEICKEIEELEKEGNVTVVRKSYDKEDIAGADIVLAATGDPEVNEAVYRDCKELGITVNVSSDKALCDFYFPGIVKEGSMVAGISASGTAHRKARLIREGLSDIMKKVSEDEA